MRCRYCGSTSLRQDIDHKTFSKGKAAAGIVTFGVVGGVAGFIGKDKKGYRCNACGGFMETPMDSFTEMQIDSAIRKAEQGRDRALFDYYKGQYINISANIQSQTDINHAGNENSLTVRQRRFQKQEAEEFGEQSSDNKELAEKAVIKNQYDFGRFYPGCPVYIESVVISTENEEDYLSLIAYNVSDGTLRSFYFNAEVLDDTGDKIQDIPCVFQQISAAPGDRLPENKRFSLKTDRAYQVRLNFEKGSFEDNVVWRADTDMVSYEVPVQPIISASDFPRMKYVITGWTRNKAASDAVRMPVKAEKFWMCDCGLPVLAGESCKRCGDSWESVEKAFSQKRLLELQQNAVKMRAAKRAEELAERVRKVKEQEARKKAEEEKRITEQKEKTYQQAEELAKNPNLSVLREALLYYKRVPGWKDADEKSVLLQEKIDKLIKEEEEQRELERQRIEKARIEQRRRKKRRIVIAASITACAALVIILVTVIIPKLQLNKAMGLIDSGNYDAAYIILEELGKSDIIATNKFDRAVLLIESEEFDKAYSLLEEIGDKDVIIDGANTLIESGNFDTAYTLLEKIGENEVIASSKYDRAIALIDAGDYETAYALLDGLNYKDNVKLLNSIKPKIQKNMLSKAEVGEYVNFGSYEQDNNISNGKEDIEWLVLSKENNHILLITRYGLDCQAYSTSSVSVTWKNCFLREWLNDTFLNEAFSPEEAKNIMRTDLDEGTSDKVFLLSINEANKYFDSDSARYCKGTAYCYGMGAYATNQGDCWWWLRTLGTYVARVAFVNYSGTVIERGNTVNNSGGVVRPALWIDLDS